MQLTSLIWLAMVKSKYGCLQFRFVNFFYITRKTYTVEQRYEILRGLMQICYIASTDKFVLSDALSVVVPDFEDMVQYHSARLISADCIVTRNVKDFATATAVKVMTPSQFLAAQ